MANRKSKIKSELTPYTVVETRDILASSIVGTMAYWIEQTGGQPVGFKAPQNHRDVLDGFGHSFFAKLDGNAMDVPMMMVAPGARYGSEEKPLGCQEGLAEEVAKLAGLSSKDLAWAESLADVGDWKPSLSVDEDAANFERDELFGRMVIAMDRWDNLSQQEPEKWGWPKFAQGFMLSVACLIEGRVPCYAGCVLRASGHEDDEAYCKKEGERWHAALTKDDPVAVHDMGGDLKIRWVQKWSSDSVLAKEATAWAKSMDERRSIGRAVENPGAASAKKPRV